MFLTYIINILNIFFAKSKKLRPMKYAPSIFAKLSFRENK